MFSKITRVIKFSSIAAVFCCTTLAVSVGKTTERLPVLVSFNNAGFWVPTYGNTGSIPYVSKDGQLMVSVKAMCLFFGAKCDIDYKTKTVNAYRAYVVDSTVATKVVQGRRGLISFEVVKKIDAENLISQNFNDPYYAAQPMVPVTSFAEVFGFTATWNPTTRMVNLDVAEDCALARHCAVGPMFVDKAVMPSYTHYYKWGGAFFSKNNPIPSLVFFDIALAPKKTGQPKKYMPYKLKQALVFQGDTKDIVKYQRLMVDNRIAQRDTQTERPLCTYTQKSTHCTVGVPAAVSADSLFWSGSIAGSVVYAYAHLE